MLRQDNDAIIQAKGGKRPPHFLNIVWDLLVRRTIKTKADWLRFSTEHKIQDLKNYLNVLAKNLEEASDNISNRFDAEFDN